MRKRITVKTKRKAPKKTGRSKRLKRLRCVVETAVKPEVAPSPDPWHLYIVRCSDGTLYTGIAKDVSKRIETHNTGKGAKYTRDRGPVTLLFQETLSDYSSALKREYQVKRLSRKGKQAFIEGKPLKAPAENSKMSFQKPRNKNKRRKTRGKPKKRGVSKLKKQSLGVGGVKDD
jgi:putative endonuclease